MERIFSERSRAQTDNSCSRVSPATNRCVNLPCGRRSFHPSLRIAPCRERYKKKSRINQSKIGSGDRDCRPVTLPHHRTCGFPHPAVEPSGYLRAARSDGMRKPERRRTALVRASVQLPVRAICQAPRELNATFSSGLATRAVVARAPGRRHGASAARRHFRRCRRIHPSSRKIGSRTSASRKYPHQPRR